jgi:hypothetical protein
MLSAVWNPISLAIPVCLPACIRGRQRHGSPSIPSVTIRSRHTSVNIILRVDWAFAGSQNIICSFPSPQVPQPNPESSPATPWGHPRQGQDAPRLSVGPTIHLSPHDPDVPNRGPNSVDSTESPLVRTGSMPSSTKPARVALVISVGWMEVKGSIKT